MHMPPGNCTCPLCRKKLVSADSDNLVLPPKYTDTNEFKKHINYELKDPTNEPREKLVDALSSFLGTDSLPKKLFDDVAMEFILITRLKADVKPSDYLQRYIFERILDLKDLPPQDEPGRQKYFQFISDKDKKIAYQLNEV